MSKVYVIANTTRVDFVLHTATADKELAEMIFEKLKIKYRDTEYADDLAMLVYDDADTLALLYDNHELALAEKRNKLTKKYPQNLLSAMNDMKLYTHTIPIDNITDDIADGIEYSISTLTEREQAIIRLRYYERQSFRAIGEQLGISRQRAFVCERNALSKLLTPPRFTYIQYGRNGYEDFIAKRDQLTQQQQATLAHQASIALAELNISARSLNALSRKGYETVADIASLTKKEISTIRNLGDQSVIEIAEALERIGTCDTAWSTFLHKQKE